MLHQIPIVDASEISSTSINPYQQYLVTARNQEKLRMGYPLTASINGFFTPQGWQKLHLGPKLIDRSILGITKDSMSDTLMLNIGDPESSLAGKSDRIAKGIHYPEDIENDIINILTNYFGAQNNFLKGYVTSGGTEANLASIWWLRNYVIGSSKLNSSLHSQNVILYTSKDSHYSCAKVCQILNIQLCEIESTSTGQINLNKLQKTLQLHMKHQPQRPMIVWLNAGTTVLGAIDDIKSVSAIVNTVVKQQHGICALHTDGAILGVTLPLLHQAYHNIFQYIDSLTLSGHKLLATTVACGVVLTKKTLVVSAFANRDITINYVHGIKDITVSGGRSCLPIFQLHQSLKYLGFDSGAERFRQLIDICLQNANILARELAKLIGQDKVIYNSKQFNVIFPLYMQETKQIELKEKYTLMPLPNNHVCVTVFPHVDHELILSFLKDYELFMNPLFPISKL